MEKDKLHYGQFFQITPEGAFYPTNPIIQLATGVEASLGSYNHQAKKSLRGYDVVAEASEIVERVESSQQNYLSEPYVANGINDGTGMRDNSTRLLIQRAIMDICYKNFRSSAHP